MGFHLYQDAYKKVEVIAKFLILFGALSDGTASHANCLAELDGELADLYDVA